MEYVVVWSRVLDGCSYQLLDVVIVVRIDYDILVNWFPFLLVATLKETEGTPRHVIAKTTMLMRKDTTQLEASAPPRVS